MSLEERPLLSRTTTMRWERRLDWGVTIAAALVVPAVYFESETHGGWHRLGATLDWLIWLTFAVELVFYLRRGDRWAWLRSHPLEVAVVALTPPFVPAAVQTIRLFRVLRLIRLLRLARSARSLLSMEGIKYVALLTALAIVGGAEAFANAEGTSSWDGLWWAIVTATTVGYGDLVPHTVLGRLIGIGLMLIGVGFVAVITGAIAQRFLAGEAERLAREASRIEHAEFDALNELREIRMRIDRVEQALRRNTAL